MRGACNACSIMLVLIALVGAAFADDLSIYDVQFNTSDGDASIYDGQIHNITGGVVTHIWAGFQTRVYIQNPDFPEWGAIPIKDWEAGELADAVQIGDWISFSSVLIEEHRGTTFLQYDRTAAPDVAFSIDSQNNPVPDATLLTAADLIIPVEHAASEPYESMIVRLENVTVGAMDLGKADDNYELVQGSDVAWGADYMNADAGGPYHPWIHAGAQLDSITGLVEQYTKLSDGWDYYQLLTRSSADIVPEPGSVALLGLGLVLVIRRRQRGAAR